MIKTTRGPHLAENIVFIDGLEGCGKTLFSSLISSFDRAEKLTYSYEIEHICTLRYLGKIDLDASETLIRMWTDLILYNSMMSREVNFRPSDLSSIFKHNKKIEYISRLFREGDEHVPAYVEEEKPILALTVHKLLSRSQPIFNALKERVRFIEIVRHPLYMLIQQSLNNEHLIETVRDFIVYYKFNGIDVPWYTKGWEKEFLELNPVEKSILYIHKMTELTEIRKQNNQANADKILTIPFENFVLKPGVYMNEIANHINSDIVEQTRNELKKQNVPRIKYSDGIPLAIYKRCGWETPESDLTELQEFQKRRDFVKQTASPKYMELLDQICIEYEEKYLGIQLNNNGIYE